MKVVITAKEDNVDAGFDLRFGRGAWFCIYDDETGDTEFKENPYRDAQGGAGTKVSELMIELGVKKAISGDFGPKAKDMLEKFDVQMVIIPNDDLSVAQIIDNLTS